MSANPPSINREQLDRQRAEIAKRRAIAEQMAQPNQRIQQAGGLVVPYSAGEGLTEIGKALLARRASKKLDERERKLYEDRATTLAGAQTELAQSVPDQQIGRESLARIMAAPEGELAEPTIGRTEATRKYGETVVGPEAYAQAELEQAMRPEQAYTLGKDQVRYQGGQEIARGPAGVPGESGQTGSLQEIEAINDYNRRKAAGQLREGEVNPSEYLSSRRGTSADKQLYAEYILGLPEGTQPKPMNEFLVEHRANVAGAEAGAKAAVIPAEDRATAQNKGPRVEAAQRRLERVSQASSALDNNMLSGGPLQGRAIGLTEEGNELDQANAQLLTELTALTRTPGLGSQSDFEQRLAQLVLPTADMYPSVRKKAIAELNSFMEDLGSQIQRIGSGQAPGAPNAQGLPPNVTEDDIAETMRANNMTREQVLERLRAGP